MNPFSPLLMMIAAGASGIALGGLLAWVWLRSRQKALPPLPSNWEISPRPVFNLSERRLYRQLKEAFPQHVVMTKLPLVRLCQPDELEKVHYWYGLLGSAHVTFTICSPNGKAVLAIDLESRRSRSKRNIEIKEAVLEKCRVKYFSMAAGGLPTVAALRLLLPQGGVELAPAADPATVAPLEAVSEGDRITPLEAVSPADRAASSHDSSVFLDSFFAPDSRLDTTDESRHAEVGGIVIDDAAPLQSGETSARTTPGR